MTCLSFLLSKLVTGFLLVDFNDIWLWLGNHFHFTFKSIFSCVFLKSFLHTVLWNTNNFKQISMTHRWHSNRYYHSMSEWILELLQWKVLHIPDLQTHHQIQFSVIPKTSLLWVLSLYWGYCQGIWLVNYLSFLSLFCAHFQLWVNSRADCTQALVKQPI